ncbi:MAG: copper oxidase [Hyphomicrobiales bacterium]|nr:copper oxidase [Hyphomicrobiales bacterium]
MKLTRRQALAGSGMALAGATLLGRDALAQASQHRDHDMRGSHAGQETRGSHGGGQTLAAKQPTGPAGTYAHPRGNDWYARTVDPDDSYPPGLPGKDYTPVVVPNGATLPFRIVDGVKVFHLVAQDVLHEFAPGFKAQCWGYNGRTPGPVIEAVEGDRIRIYVTNKLQVPTVTHWHAVILPCNMDGVSGLTQQPIKPGETFRYEFKAVQHGTFMYHSHKDAMTQEGMGLVGMLVIHPRKPKRPRPDRDFSLMLHEWDIKPGTYRPDTSVSSGFNTLTLNAKVFPGTAPLVAKLGERVRIRIGNLSAMDHHPIHLHGHAFRVTETDGGEIPEAAQWPETTVLVSVGQTRNIEFVADNPGDWAMHCHMTHHTMNQMGHGLPNMVGVKPGRLDRKVANLLPGYMTMGTDGMGEMGLHAQHMDMPENSIPMVGAPGPYSYIGMGGMFTILKVRETLASYDDPGWYVPPEGTMVRPATAAELQRDGIEA